MTSLRARDLAVQFVIDCLTDVEADGHQQHEESEWYQEGPELSVINGASFNVTIGDHVIKFSASAIRRASPTATER